MSTPTPIWTRLPYRGECKVSGLKRGKLERLCVPSARNNHRPPVRSVTLREPGQRRAMRLIHVPSLLAYLDHLADEQAAQQS